METEEDFVWRFKINESPKSSLCQHPLDELIRVQWEELLKLCVPTFRGKEIKIDGFKLMKDENRIIPIYRDDPSWES